MGSWYDDANGSYFYRLQFRIDLNVLPQFINYCEPEALQFAIFRSMIILASNLSAEKIRDWNELYPRSIKRCKPIGGCYSLEHESVW